MEIGRLTGGTIISFKATKTSYKYVRKITAVQTAFWLVDNLWLSIATNANRHIISFLM